MRKENPVVYDYLDRYFRNGNELANVKIGSNKFDHVKVSITKNNDEFVLSFENQAIIDLLEGQKEYPVDLNHFEISETDSSLCTCYAGNHIEIKWEIVGW